MSDPSTDNDKIQPSLLNNIVKGDCSEIGEGRVCNWVGIESDDGDATHSYGAKTNEIEIEAGEDELDEGVQGPKDHICHWADL